MKQQGKKVILFLLIIMMCMSLVGIPLSAAEVQTKVNEQYKVAEGIYYNDFRLKDSTTNQAIRVMEVDLNESSAMVDIGIPSALNKLERTTLHALRNNTKEQAVVGAINASFFYSGTAMNLVSNNNKLVHSGQVYVGEDKYVNEPIAFGVDANGQGIIDHYKLDMSYIHNDNTYSITATNKQRYSNETILFTSNNPSDYTNTNRYGTEVVVTLPKAPEFELGSIVEGKVTSVRPEGETDKTTIPTNGFVLSGNGTGSEALENVRVGDTISLSIQIDNKWENSSFMLASGPLLVENGKVSLSMDPTSINARIRAPRTAVAIDETGDKVFFITVDGRQRGYSNGMNLTEFAKYLVDLGAYRALNLDGGGSTTMGVRHPFSEYLTLANRPSDGNERSVSTILMALSTAPRQIFSDLPPSHWAASSVHQLVFKGTVKGYPDKTFHPEESISRSHAAVFLTREFGLDTTNITNPNFKDVKPTDPYYNEIAAVANAGLMNGREIDVFAKDGQLTRAELAVILQRAYKIPYTTESYYSDLKSNHYAYGAINAITASDLAGGYPNGTFKPNQLVTRAEFNVFLYRANN